MSTFDNIITLALNSLSTKPAHGTQAAKKHYSEQMSHRLAGALAACFTHAGLANMQPTTGPDGVALGQERRMAGGIGGKKVDVTCATAESGLLLGASIKTINWRDSKSGSFQKNLTNRRGDLLFESVTLHRRFPYAVLVGVFVLDAEAAHDGSPRRESTFINAHLRLSLFTGRNDPFGRDEQYERLYIGLVHSEASNSWLKLYEAGKPDIEVSVEQMIEEVSKIFVARNPDEYTSRNGKISKI